MALNIILLLVILVPLNYSLFVIYKGSPPPAIETQVSNTHTTNNNNTVAASPATNNSPVNAAQQAVNTNPGWETYVNLGLALYYAHDYPASLKAYQKALEYNPKVALIYSDIGVSYGAMGQWEEQIKYCEEALKIDPDFQLAKNNITWAKNELNKKGK